MTADDLPRGRTQSCHTHKCVRFASYVVSWPRQPRLMCSPCAVRAIHVGSSMGLAITANRIGPDDPSDDTAAVG